MNTLTLDGDGAAALRDAVRRGAAVRFVGPGGFELTATLESPSGPTDDGAEPDAAEDEEFYPSGARKAAVDELEAWWRANPPDPADERWRGWEDDFRALRTERTRPFSVIVETLRRATANDGGAAGAAGGGA